MEAINNIKDKLTGQTDSQTPSAAGSAAVCHFTPPRMKADNKPTQPSGGAGEFPKPGAFPVETQVDRVVGIQDDMERKPEGAAVQEGQDSFDQYKPAGKVRFLFLLYTSSQLM
jgi:hypothetical protein